MNGWDAAGHLNANTTTRISPVIALAGGAMMVGQDKVLGTHYVDCNNKPASVNRDLYKDQHLRKRTDEQATEHYIGHYGPE